MCAGKTACGVISPSLRSVTLILTFGFGLQIIDWYSMPWKGARRFLNQAEKEVEARETTLLFRYSCSPPGKSGTLARSLCSVCFNDAATVLVGLSWDVWKWKGEGDQMFGITKDGGAGLTWGAAGGKSLLNKLWWKDSNFRISDWQCVGVSAACANEEDGFVQWFACRDSGVIVRLLLIESVPSIELAIGSAVF